MHARAAQKQNASRTVLNVVEAQKYTTVSGARRRVQPAGGVSRGGVQVNSV